MHTERLRRLARFLREEVPRDRFDMRYWCDAKPDVPVGTADVTVCETTACAFGWATAVPEFKTAGLHLKVTSVTNGVVYLANPRGADYPSFDAAAKFFDISYTAADWLFDPDEYEIDRDDEEWGPVTVDDVADRIDELIANDGLTPDELDDEEDDE